MFSLIYQYSRYLQLPHSIPSYSRVFLSFFFFSLFLYFILYLAFSLLNSSSLSDLPSYDPFSSPRSSYAHPPFLFHSFFLRCHSHLPLTLPLSLLPLTPSPPFLPLTAPHPSPRYSYMPFPPPLPSSSFSSSSSLPCSPTDKNY